MKYRKPLTDIYNRDIYTGELIECELSDRLKETIERKKREFKNKKVVNWKIYVEWFGLVPA